MNFTSTVFAAFCLCVYPVYFLLSRKVRWRNIFIIGVSYLFYGWWDWRFLFLILFTCSVDFKVAQWIEASRNERWKKRLLLISVVSNLGVLGYFKYYNFFIGSFSLLVRRLGLHVNLPTLHIILPVGISFYTFQSLAYVFDVYKNRIRAEQKADVFYAFVAFFPQLAAGPIERAAHMLPQFHKVCLPSSADVRSGIWLIISGYFTKIVVADTLAPWVNINFAADQRYGWSTILATVAFGVQIYGDFKGYSVIAKGLARLLGFELMWNFRFPYWSCSVQEFWHRWHISLSTWLRDYLYIPLGGSRVRTPRLCANIMITMFLGGLWHGAGWNFLAWGIWHGAALCVNHLFRQMRGDFRHRCIGWILTMLVVFIGWFFFRATDDSTMCSMLNSLHNLAWQRADTSMLTVTGLMIALVGCLEYVEISHGEDQLVETKLNPKVLLSIEIGLLIGIFAASQRPAVDFIYFQF